MKRLALGSDHAGYALKEKLKKLLEERGIAFEDLGCHSEGSVDYPDYALPVAERVARGDCDGGILICGTGLGMSMAANRVRGVRAALCTSEFHARFSREHNNANILVLGGRVTGFGHACAITLAWLDAEFEGGRHERRVGKLDACGG